jgi:hypothetical protein
LRLLIGLLRFPRGASAPLGCLSNDEIDDLD